MADKGVQGGRLLLGDVAEELFGAFRDEIARWVRADPLVPGVVLVGSNLLVLQLRRRLALAGVSHVGLRFVTFIDLGHALAASARGERRSLPPGGRRLLARTLTREEVDSESDYFGPVRARPGFHRRLEATFGDLDDAGFSETFETLAADRALRDPKLQNLLRFYAAYRKRISAGWTTTSDLIREGAARGADFESVFGSRRLALYSLYDFTQVQRRLLSSLAKHATITAFVPDPGLPGCRFAAHGVRFLEKLGLARARVESPADERGDSDLDRIRMNLFAAVPEPHENDSTVSTPAVGAPAAAQLDLFAASAPAMRDTADQLALFSDTATAREASRSRGSSSDASARIEFISAPSEVEEAREIARKILQLARDEGIPFREMAVLLRSANDYAPLIAEALEEASFDGARVPVSVSQGLSLGRSAAARGLKLLLGLAGGPLGRSAVIEFVTGAGLSDTVMPRGRISPSTWDRVTRIAGIVEGREEWEGRLRRFAGAPSPAEGRRGSRRPGDRRAAETLLALTTRLFDDLAALPARGAWRDYSKATQELLCTWIARPTEEPQSWDAIARLVAGISGHDELVGDTALEEFRAALFDEIDETNQSRGRFGIDAVTVTGIHRARGLRFRVVFLPGIVERGFPAPPSTDPILLDRDRDRLNKTGHGRLALARERAAEEELLFAFALGAASDRAILSYPRSTAGTMREMNPSHFLLRLGEARVGHRLDYDRLEKLPFFRRIRLSSAGPEDPDDAVSLAERRLAVAARADRATRDALVKSVGGTEEGRLLLRATQWWNARWCEPRWNAHTGALGKSAAKRLLAGRPILGARLTPTSMQNYATCPYRYFLKHRLELGEIPEPEKIEEMDRLDRGSLVHRILENLYGELAEQKLVPLDASRLSAAREKLGEVAALQFHAAEERGITGFPLLWEIERARILDALGSFLAADAAEASRRPGLQPVFLEKNFGDDGQTPAKIELAKRRELSFRGKIDRIDADAAAGASRFRVIDYKTTSRQRQPRKPADPLFDGGKRLQLPVYLLAAPEILDCKPSAEGDAQFVYIAIGVKGEPPLRVTNRQLEARRDDLARILTTISDGIEGGFYPVNPDRGENCRFCDYSEVCGPTRAIQLQYERKAGDPRMDDFKGLGAIVPPEPEPKR